MTSEHRTGIGSLPDDLVRLDRELRGIQVEVEEALRPFPGVPGDGVLAGTHHEPVAAHSPAVSDRVDPFK